jgi:hypothetical protein
MKVEKGREKVQWRVLSPVGVLTPLCHTYNDMVGAEGLIGRTRLNGRTG